MTNPENLTKKELVEELAKHGVEANESALKDELVEKLTVVTGQAEVKAPPAEGDGEAGPPAEQADTEPEPEPDDRIERGAKALHQQANPNGRPWSQLQSAVRERYCGFVTAILEATDE